MRNELNKMTTADYQAGKIQVAELQADGSYYQQKLAVHHAGIKHFAFSVLIFNKNGQMLLQQRAGSKYHSGGLWTNACCGHYIENYPNELVVESRVDHEMGITVVQFSKIFQFEYYKHFENGLIENEIDDVYVAYYNADPKPDLQEVDNWKWMELDEIKQWAQKRPEDFTYWFHLILTRISSGIIPIEPEYNISV